MCSFFVTDDHHMIMADTNEETIREFWKNYRAFRYDFIFSFHDFLRENGIRARKAPRFLRLLPFTGDSIRICLN